MSLSAATLLILRKRKQGEINVEAGFPKNITPLLCVLFVIAYGFVATAVVIDKPMAALTGVVLMVIFMILYFAFYHKRATQVNS
jgi:amino acid transporter